MNYSEFKEQSGDYQVYESNAFPSFSVDQGMRSKHGFLPIDAINIKMPINRSKGEKRKSPKGVIISGSGLGQGKQTDPLADFALFVGKIWLVGKVIGRW